MLKLPGKYASELISMEEQLSGLSCLSSVTMFTADKVNGPQALQGCESGPAQDRPLSYAYAHMCVCTHAYRLSPCAAMPVTRNSGCQRSAVKTN